MMVEREMQVLMLTLAHNVVAVIEANSIHRTFAKYRKQLLIKHNRPPCIMRLVRCWAVLSTVSG